MKTDAHVRIRNEKQEDKTKDKRTSNVHGKIWKKKKGEKNI